MIPRPRIELCRELIRQGEKPPLSMIHWQDEQAYEWFSDHHPTLYGQVMGLPPKLEIVR